jgi:hypothetical protein
MKLTNQETIALNEAIKLHIASWARRKKYDVTFLKSSEFVSLVYLVQFQFSDIPDSAVVHILRFASSNQSTREYYATERQPRQPQTIGENGEKLTATVANAIGEVLSFVLFLLLSFSCVWRCTLC